MRGRIINREWWWSILQSVATFGRWCCSLVNSVAEWWSPSSPPITTDCTDCSSVWSSRQQQQKCLLTDPALLMDRRFRIEWEKIAATTIIFFSFFSSFQPLSALLHYFVWLTACLTVCLPSLLLPFFGVESFGMIHPSSLLQSHFSLQTRWLTDRHKPSSDQRLCTKHF